MCDQAMEPEVSMRYMTFGFTTAVLLLASGTFEMSVGAAKAGAPATEQRSVAYRAVRFVRIPTAVVVVFMVLPPRGASVHHRLDVACGVSRSEDGDRDAEIGLRCIRQRLLAIRDV